MDLNQNAKQPQQPPVPLPVQNQVVEPATNSSSFSKTLLIILGVFIVLGLIGGGYYLGTKNMHANLVVKTNINKITPSPEITNAPTITEQPMPSQTGNAADWLTYTNTTLGITFSYPKGYLIVQEQTNQIRLLRGLNYVFEVRRLPITDTVNSWWQNGAQLDANGSQLNTKDYIKSPQPWNDYQAYFFKLNSNNYQVPMNFYAIRIDNANYTSSAIYTISYETEFPLSDPTYQQVNTNFDKTDKPVIAKILDSFRFIDPHFSMSDY